MRGPLGGASLRSELSPRGVSHQSDALAGRLSLSSPTPASPTPPPPPVRRFLIDSLPRPSARAVYTTARNASLSLLSLSWFDSNSASSSDVAWACLGPLPLSLGLGQPRCLWPQRRGDRCRPVSRNCRHLWWRQWGDLCHPVSCNCQHHCQHRGYGVCVHNFLCKLPLVMQTPPCTTRSLHFDGSTCAGDGQAWASWICCGGGLSCSCPWCFF